MPDITLILPILLKGLAVTVGLAAGAAALALPVALCAGLARLSGRRYWRWPATVYVELFRGTSALVQLFWCYFVLPLWGLSLSAVTAGVLVLGLNAGAYGAEIVRGALQAVPEGQRQAAEALNMTRPHYLWRIGLPQALPAMLPPLGNLLIELLKNTALASLITLAELTFTAQLLRMQMLHSAGIFSLVLLLYFAVALAIMRGMRAAEQALARRQGRWPAPTGGG